MPLLPKCVGGGGRRRIVIELRLLGSKFGLFVNNVWIIFMRFHRLVHWKCYSLSERWTCRQVTIATSSENFYRLLLCWCAVLYLTGKIPLDYCKGSMATRLHELAVQMGQELRKIEYKDQSWLGMKTRSRKSSTWLYLSPHRVCSSSMRRCMYIHSSDTIHSQRLCSWYPPPSAFSSNCIHFMFEFPIPGVLCTDAGGATWA